MAHPNTVFVLFLNIGISHADGEVARVVVGVYQVFNYINLADGVALQKISLYSSLNGSVELLYHGRILLSFTYNVLDIVALH